MAAEVVSVDSRFLSLFTEICQLKGYKEALYDSQVRFHPKESTEKLLWAEELRCFDDLLMRLCTSLQGNPQLDIAGLRSCLLSWVTETETEFGTQHLRTLAVRRVAERVMELVITAEKGNSKPAFQTDAEPDLAAA